MKKHFKLCVSLSLLISLSLVYSSAFNKEEKTLKKASFVPLWFPQAQFGGYYVAYEQGFYEKYGIDLDILTGGSERSATDFLGSHKVDFAVVWLSDAIQRRAKGMKLVNIAQIIQRSALMFIAKKSSRIKTPQDINGKKVGLWRGDFQLQPRAFFRKYNLDVKIIPQSLSTDYINLFLMDAVDVTTAMWYNEYHFILNSGINPDELIAFFFHDYGLNFPEDGLYVLEDTLRKDPELCRGFVKASLEGWQYAFEHPDKALDIILEYMRKVHVPANRVHQKWMLARMKDIIIPQSKSVPLGTLLREDYERGAQMLKDNDLIIKIPLFESFYNKFK
ncbi:MAG: ABC transporter substrate-binding protein [Candidatus Aminicenantes bacterium]|nr:MAG: ABC transporter substrate-binding protein [Candidatus Aminicenantes bacterium]